MSYSTSVVAARVEIAVAVVERDGEFLIGLRGEGTPLAGKWEFPGGKIGEGESPEDAARRECWEETGVAVRITGSYPTTTFDYPHASLRIHFLAAEPIDVPAHMPQRFMWVPRAELGEYEFPPANAEVLRLLKARKSSSA
jgi:8-oxo-dGTP diphosphatase